MKKVSTMVGAAVVGVLMAATASAQLVPGGGGSAGTANDGGLLVAVWDGVRSVVQYLGSTLSQNDRATLTTEGSAGISRTFGVDLTGFDLANTQFIVVAADSVNPGRLYTTTSQPPTSVTQLGTLINSFAGQVNGYINDLFGASGACAGLTVCVADTASDAKYWTVGGQGSFPFVLSGLYGSSLEFWDLTKTASLGTGSSATRYASTDGTRTGVWSLTGTGANATLSYAYPAATQTEVPLPAAAWLLMSGLLGLGAVGRRRQAAAA